MPSPGARTLHPALGTSATVLTCSRPRWTHPPGCGSGAQSCVPSPVSQRRRGPITCPVTAAGTSGPGQPRPPILAGSGSADCPAVRFGAGRAMTARGNSVTAVEGLGPWLEIAGLKYRWAPSPSVPCPPP